MREKKFTFGILSPAGGLDGGEFDAGLSALERRGFAAKVFPHARGKAEYLSAGVEERASDFNAAWADSGIDAVLCSRGGFGSAHLLPLLDWKKLKSRDLPLLGYSDITALHLAMDRYGVGRAIAAPMLRHFPALDAGSLNSLLDVLRRKDHECGAVEELTAKAVFSGRPLAGNLTVAASLLGTPYFPDPTGRALVLEEVGEPLYRIDRALTQLRLAGAFERCAGVVFGNFTDCGEADAVAAVLRDFADKIKSPVFTGLSFGHELPFHALSTRQTITVSA